MSVALRDTPAQDAARGPDPAGQAPVRGAAPGPVAAQRALGLHMLPAAEQALAEIAPQFDMAPTPDLMRFDRAGFGLPGAAGRVEGGRVVLHPDRFDPRLPLGRAVLAHELAHLFQQALPQGRASGGAPLLAELEARAIGARVAEGRGFARPVEPVAPGRVLYDQSLEELVATRFAGEIARIKRLLRGWLGFLWVTDGAVSEIFTLVEAQDFATTQAIFRALDRGERATLMDNVSPGHFPRFRTQILAAFSVTERGTLAEQDEALFDGMEVTGLSRDEILAVHHVFNSGYPAQAQARLMADESRGRYMRQIVQAEGGINDLAGLPDGQTAGAYRRDRAEAARDRLVAEADTRATATQAAEADTEATEAIAQLRGWLDDPGDTERLQALDLMGTFLNRPTVLSGIVLTLQPVTMMDGPIDRLLDDFPTQALVEASSQGPTGSRHRRIETMMRVAEQRPPWKNALLAERLLSSGWFNTLTSSEAFMAFQILKALPDRVRSGFLEENGGARAEALYGAMSQSMREGAGLNFYRGGEGRLDLASIQSQLMDDTLWDASAIGRLSGLIRMAGAAGQAEWLFGRSREVALARPGPYQDRAFKAQIVEPYMLYGSRAPDGGTRTEWQPAYGDWAIEGFLQRVWAPFGKLGNLFVLLGDSRNGWALVGNAIFGHSVGGEGISAAAFQDLMGGAFMGIRFVAPEDRIQDPELARQVAEADEADRGVNYIDRAYWDTERGVLELSARDLAIAAIRYPIGDTLVSTGAGRMRGLDMTLSYAARESQGRPTNMELEIGTLELGDLLVVFRDSMIAINRVEVQGLNVRLGRDAMQGDAPSARRGIDGWRINPVTPILRLIGLSDYLGEQAGVMVRALTEPAEATPLMIDVTGLVLHGVQTSGGQYFETIGLENARIGIAGSVEDYQRILWHSIRSNVAQKVDLMRAAEGLPPGAARAEMTARMDRIDARVTALQALRADLTRHSETFERLHPRRDSLTQDEAAQLQAATDFLAPYRQGGITFDAGRITVTGAEGGIGLGALELRNVHGHGGGAPGLLAFLTDSEALNRIAQGPAHAPPLRAGATRGTAQFSLDLGDIELNELRIGAGIPTVEDARKAVTQAEEARDARDWDPRLQAAYQAAQLRLERTLRYRDLAAVGLTYLPAPERAELVRLRTQLMQDEALYVHHLEASNTRIGFDADRGAVSLSADRFEARGRHGATGPDADAIRIGGPQGVRLGAAEGDQLALSVGVQGGLHGFASLQERLQRAGLSGDRLRLERVAHGPSGVGAEALEAESFDLDLRARDWRLDARAKRLHGDRIYVRITRTGLETQIQGLENRGAARRSDAEEARLAALREALDIYTGFETVLRDLQADLDAARTDAARDALRADIRGVLDSFDHWEREMGARTVELRGLDATLSGTENLAETGFDFDRSLETGITVQGRGRSETTGRTDRIFESISVTGARLGPGEAQQIDIGETAGRVVYGRRVIEVSDLAIASAAVSHFHWTTHSAVAAEDGGGSTVTQFYSDGTSDMTGLRVTARLEFEPIPDTDGEYRLARVQMPRLDIDQIRGDGLGYYRHHHPPTEGPRDPSVSYGQSEYRFDGGQVTGVHVRDLSATLPASEDESLQLSSHIRVDAINNLQASAYIEGTLNHARARVSTGSIDFDLSSAGGVTRLSNVRVPSVTVHRFNVRARGGKSVRADAPLRLRGIRADAALDSSDPDNSVVTLTSLHISSISGDDLTVGYPPYTVHIRQDDTVALDALIEGRDPPAPLSIANLDVRGLRWSSRDGITPSSVGQAATIDVGSVHAAFNAMTEDESINLDAVVDASTIDFDFLHNGTQRLSIADVDARFSGQAGSGITVESEIRDLSTGDVTFDGRRISVPNLSIPTLALNQLDWDSDKMRVQVPEVGGRVELTGTTAALDLTRAPEGSEAPFEQLRITQLLVPQITMRGVVVTLKDVMTPETGPEDLVITIPSSQDASITNLRLDPLEGGAAFTITPDPSGVGDTVMEGRLHMGAIAAPELRAHVGSLLSAQANVSVSKLDFDFLGAGGQQLSIEQIKLREVTGRYESHMFNITRGAAGSAFPEATINGLRRRADGTVTVDSAALSGLVYTRPDLGVRLDIREAELPERQTGAAFTFGADGSAVLPEVIVRDAQFHVDDLSNMGDSAGDGAAGPPMLEHMDFLDALSGTLNATIGIPVSFLPDDDISLRFRNGRIGLDDIENELWTDGAIDFDFDDDTDRLVLNIDWGNALVLLYPIAGPLSLIPPFIPQANSEAVAFALEEQDEIQEARRRQVRLSTLATRIESSGGGGGSSDPPLSLYNIDANFNLGPTRVDLRDIGGLLVQGDGNPRTSDLFVDGALYPAGEGRSALNLRLNELTAQVDPARPLSFAGEGGARTTVQSGALRIRQLRDTTLRFHGFSTPGELDGHIEEARLTNIRVTRTEAEEE